MNPLPLKMKLVLSSELATEATDECSAQALAPRNSLLPSSESLKVL